MGDRATARAKWVEKWGAAALLFVGRAGSPSNTMLPGLMSASVLSGVLIVQPFGHNTSTLQDRQTDNSPIAQGEPFYKQSHKNAASLQHMDGSVVFVRLLLLLLLSLFLRAAVQPLWTHTLRPFYDRPIELTQEGRSLVNDVCKCVRD